MAKDPWEAAAAAYKSKPDVQTGTSQGVNSLGQPYFAQGQVNLPDEGQATSIEPPPQEDVWDYQGPQQERLSTEIAKELAPAAGQLGIGALKGLGSDILSHTRFAPYVQPKNELQSMGRGTEQAAEFLLPGLGEEAATAYLGRLAPLGRVAYSGLTSGLINKAQGGSFGLGAAAGGAAGGIGESLRALAPSVAESALGVRKLDRAYGKAPGRAILNETKGFSPGMVAESAQNRLDELNPQLENAANRWSNLFGPVASLQPARSVVGDALNTAATRNAAKETAQLAPLDQFLRQRFDTGAPIPSNVTPSQLLDLRRGFGGEFVHNWNPETLPGVTGTARNAYRALSNELHTATPETAPLDLRISNLIPVAKRAESASMNAPIGQRIAGRLKAHTGAATLGGIGAIGGYERGGPKKALEYGLIGLAAPEMLAAPSVQMAGARSLASPVLQRGLLPLMAGGALQLNQTPVSTDQPQKSPQPPEKKAVRRAVQNRNKKTGTK